eukprot:TRINITY_DN18150_c0_g1_i2.p1 TRINITY_DN18150_c0_g1~~TRINITY_DN18150_c0_g1_i2.p1  ORF type:complete len:378 (-),score=66.16 TRINITY_DN18150_c0_g1_i2:108-1241(-)
MVLRHSTTMCTVTASGDQRSRSLRGRCLLGLALLAFRGAAVAAASASCPSLVDGARQASAMHGGDSSSAIIESTVSTNSPEQCLSGPRRGRRGLAMLQQVREFRGAPEVTSFDDGIGIGIDDSISGVAGASDMRDDAISDDSVKPSKADGIALSVGVAETDTGYYDGYDNDENAGAATNASNETGEIAAGVLVRMLAKAMGNEAVGRGGGGDGGGGDGASNATGTDTVPASASASVEGSGSSASASSSSSSSRSSSATSSVTLNDNGMVNALTNGMGVGGGARSGSVGIPISDQSNAYIGTDVVGSLSSSGILGGTHANKMSAPSSRAGTNEVARAVGDGAVPMRSQQGVTTMLGAERPIVPSQLAESVSEYELTGR